eukprot:gb/GECH01010195.1/.p1 GENE.gb/GECH01010195.1/~~gb/GECH01010195.1/.p1  ORF type:complete len:187 (+),score=10.73 gb/GECH01010195.1/:1-561(+)
MVWTVHSKFLSFEFVLDNLYKDSFFLYMWRNKGVEIPTSVRQHCPHLRSTGYGAKRRTWPSPVEQKKNLFAEYCYDLERGDVVHYQEFCCGTCNNCSASWRIIQYYQEELFVKVKGNHKNEPNENNVKLDYYIREQIDRSAANKLTSTIIEKQFMKIAHGMKNYPRGAKTASRQFMIQRRAYINHR